MFLFFFNEFEKGEKDAAEKFLSGTPVHIDGFVNLAHCSPWVGACLPTS